MKSLNKENFSFYKKKPYLIFEIKDFIEKDKFEILKKSFPNKKYFIDSEDHLTKKIFGSKHIDFDNFFLQNSSWLEFINNFNNPDFLNNAYKLSLIDNIKHRGITFLKKWTFNNTNIFKKCFYRKVYVKSYFGRHEKNQLVHPHTDARSKLFSMIYYVSGPEDQTGGTEFWDIKKNKIKWKNDNSIHLKDKDKIEEFKKDAQLIHKSKFIENTLVGFIRNDYSWHSVLDVGNLKDSSERKTLNLFYRY